MDNETPQSLDFVVHNDDTLWTESAFKVWWLKKFRGYRIIAVRQVPSESAFGGVKYTRKWLIGRSGRAN